MQPLLRGSSQHTLAPPARSLLLVCYFHCFLKNKVKEHTGAGGSAPTLPQGFGDAPEPHQGFLQAAVVFPASPRGSAMLGTPGPLRVHPCWLGTKKLLGKEWMSSEDAAVAAASQKGFAFCLK